MTQGRYHIFRSFLIAYILSAVFAFILIGSTTPNIVSNPYLQQALIKVTGFIFILYLCGSIPFGLIFTKVMMNQDVRDIGSGNIGMTNVLRTGNKMAAILTLIFDVLKGYLPLLILKPHIEPLFSTNIYFFAYLVPVLGHMFPCWLKFKGGKGIATGFGVALYFFWPLALVMLAIWIAVAKLTRISSLGGLIAFAGFPIATTYFTNFSVAAWTYALAVLVFLAHRDNIKKILSGQENKFGDPTI